MTELDDIDLMAARGRYSTIRAQHEDAKKALSILCGELSSYAAQILRVMQPNNDGIPENVSGLLTIARWKIDEIEKTVVEIESLAKMRQELKPLAWPK